MRTLTSRSPSVHRSRRRKSAHVHRELRAIVGIRTDSARLRVLLVTAAMPHPEQEAAWRDCCKLAEQLQVQLCVLELAAKTAPSGLRARIAVERTAFNALYDEACRMALSGVGAAPVQLAEVIDLAETRQDRANLAALRALHLRMDAAEVMPANDTAVAS
jgi:hypothetical protein